jgi:succinate dehydrogenase / fumarate reductase cytochrome b subunit
VSATETPLGAALLDRNHFLLRRLHSLTGIVPVGAFLAEHLLTNSGSWYGPARYNKDVRWIQDMPFLFVLEWGFIFLPLAFHAIYGFYIAWTGQMNAATYPYMNNRRYALQRITAYMTLGFVIIHLLKYRFAYLLGGPVFADAPDWFALTKQGLLHWHFAGLAVPAWFTLGFYIVGLTAAVYHFANGIWTFAISWGILGGPDSQRWFQYVCLMIGIVMCVWGYISLWGFVFNG